MALQENVLICFLSCGLESPINGKDIVHRELIHLSCTQTKPKAHWSAHLKFNFAFHENNCSLNPTSERKLLSVGFTKSVLVTLTLDVQICFVSLVRIQEFCVSLACFTRQRTVWYKAAINQIVNQAPLRKKMIASKGKATVL